MRIDNVKPEVINLLRSINVEIEKEITKKADISAQKSKLYRQLLSLPILKESLIADEATTRMNALGIAGIFLSEQIYLPERLTNFYNMFEKNPMGIALIKSGKITPDFYPAAFAAMNDTAFFTDQYLSYKTRIIASIENLRNVTYEKSNDKLQRAIIELNIYIYFLVLSLLGFVILIRFDKPVVIAPVKKKKPIKKPIKKNEKTRTH
jgi:hypothetical protein